MKKLIFSLIFGCLAFLNLVLAQPDPEENQERIEALKVGFITRRLNLSAEEAQKFWPVYNQYSAELKGLKQESKLMKKGMNEDFSTMNDKEIEQFADEFIANRQKEVDIMKKYHGEFKKILPVRKVALLYKADREFKMTMLKEIKERRENGGGRPGMKGPKPVMR